MSKTILDMESLIIEAEGAVNKAANVIDDMKDKYFSLEDAIYLHAYKENAETKCDIVRDYIIKTSELVSQMYRCFVELTNEERSKQQK